MEDTICHYYARFVGHDGVYRQLHIGKCRFGWAFALHVGFFGDPDYTPRTWGAWKDLLHARGTRIVNQHGTEIAFDDFIDVVENRRLDFCRGGGLLRQRVGANGCVSQCLGNDWDEVRGDFE